MRNNRFDFKRMMGGLALLGSALCFYFATAAIRWSTAYVNLEPALFVFFRFLLGFFFVCLVLLIRRQPLSHKRYDLLFARTIANCVAVYCFYKGVVLTSVATANILNMTYPLFITIFSWVFSKKYRDMAAVMIVLAAFAGVCLILSPGEIGLNKNNLWGLASGISASLAIISLNASRKYHDSETILFHMFGLGAIIMFIFFRNKIFLPNAMEFYYLALCSAFGFGGQYLLTAGFLYVTAVEGGIISSTRILFAALLGPYVVSDPHLSLSGWIGALLIFGANVFLAFRKT